MKFQFDPELARALHTLGGRHAALRDYSAAEATLAEAVAIYLRLVEATRDKYRPELACCLNDRA